MCPDVITKEQSSCFKTTTVFFLFFYLLVTQTFWITARPPRFFSVPACRAARRRITRFVPADADPWPLSVPPPHLRPFCRTSRPLHLCTLDPLHTVHKLKVRWGVLVFPLKEKPSVPASHTRAVRCWSSPAEITAVLLETPPADPLNLPEHKETAARHCQFFCGAAGRGLEELWRSKVSLRARGGHELIHFQ